jgi:hypothetical protein
LVSLLVREAAFKLLDVCETGAISVSNVVRVLGKAVDNERAARSN